MFHLNRIFNLKINNLFTQHENQSMNLFGSANMFTWFTMSGLESTEPRLERLNLANASSRSIATFFSVSNEYVPWMVAKRKEEAERRSWRWIGKRWWCSGAEETNRNKNKLVWKKFSSDVCWTISAIHFIVIHDSAMKKSTYYFFLIVLMFALLPKIYSSVYEKEYSMSALNKLPF